MRHKRAGRKLNRDTHDRKALFRSLIRGLVLHGEIKTTEAKAKAVKRIAEKLITQAKKKTLHQRRQILAFLQEKKAVNILVDEIASQFVQIKGGFTRITRINRRRGDNALIVKLAWTKNSKASEVSKDSKVNKISKDNKESKKGK